MPGIEPVTSCMLDKHGITALQFQLSWFGFVSLRQGLSPYSSDLSLILFIAQTGLNL